MLTAAGTVAAPQADAAAMFYWQDSDPSYYRPMPTVQPRKPKTRRPSTKTEAAVKETNAKPQGPLIIAVSIDQQKVRVYDAKGLFAESPVSTGMKGHSTPMGVFSVIQKHKMHRSNIYSGAPMPYMQRITWSGVAMHAGVLPGYPASHGCIRMPTTFAVKMWNWTRMGARVIITPGVISPASFSHPLLVAQKVVPQPLIADDPTTDAPAVKGDKGADAGSVTKSANSNSEASLELRSTVGHAAPLRQQTHTAEARGPLSTMNAVVTMSDATPSAAKVQPVSDTSSAEAEADAPKPEPTTPAAGAADTAAKSAATGAGATDGKKASERANTEAPTAAIANGGPAKVEALKAEETEAAEKPAEPIKAAADAPAVSVVAPDAKKDTARLPGAEKAARAEPPRRPGLIAVFVSRKDSKLYVRENFKPQFDVPVTIAASDRPLGTHVFTAEADKNDPNLLRWSVVSLPVAARHSARIDNTDRTARRGKMAAPGEPKPLLAANSPAEALDRIAAAPEAMARIAELLTTGSSIIVSDHSINTGGETGEGTDFIVPLRTVQP
ncbi:L,D-transpeptidase [Bradyrhizobium australiense]|nr:L,D-transpeptidase [Bradyrhizobium australiense]